jgi:hypothetical protein
MSSPPGDINFFGAAWRAARSGRYPNSIQPGGFQFNAPAFAPATSPSSDGTTTHTSRPYVTNPNQGSSPNEQAGTNPSASSGTTIAAVPFGKNGTPDHTHTPDSIALDDADYSTPNAGIGNERSNDTEMSSAPDLSPEPRGRKRKRNPGAKSRASRPKKEAPGITTHQRAAAKKAKPTKSEPSKAKGSGQALSAERFATTSYIESQSLRPPTGLLKPTQSSNDPGIPASASTAAIHESQEFKDLVKLLDTEFSSLREPYFNPGEDTRPVDKEIAAGFKRSQNDEYDRPKRGKKNQELSFNGLNTNLPPLDNINDIFVDITLNALRKGFKKFLDALGSGKLKVSTLCSGTESPLLALQMIQDCEAKNILPIWKLSLTKQRSKRTFPPSSRGFSPIQL